MQFVFHQFLELANHYSRHLTLKNNKTGISVCYDRVIYPEHIVIHPVEIITEEKELSSGRRIVTK